VTTNASPNGSTWNHAWNEETLGLAYEITAQREPIYGEWADAIDTKAIGVFTVASAILTLVPSLNHPVPHGFPLLVWLLAAAFWFAAARCCYEAYRPRYLEIGPNPSTLRCAEWLSLKPAEYRFEMLGFMGQTYEANKRELNRKAEALREAVWYTGGEVLALAVAIFLGVLF
jgi:hypothetical protein